MNLDHIARKTVMEIYRMFDLVFADEDGTEKWVEDQEIFSACSEIATYEEIESALHYFCRAGKIKKKVVDGKNMWMIFL